MAARFFRRHLFYLSQGGRAGDHAWPGPQRHPHPARCEYVIRSILIPDEYIVEGFQQTSSHEDGRKLFGMIQEETAETVKFTCPPASRSSSARPTFSSVTTQRTPHALELHLHPERQGRGRLDRMDHDLQ